jgi:hypothetical protein
MLFVHPYITATFNSQEIYILLWQKVFPLNNERIVVQFWIFSLDSLSFEVCQRELEQK